MTNKIQQRRPKKGTNKKNTNRVNRATVAPASIGALIIPPTYSISTSSNGTIAHIRGNDILGETYCVNPSTIVAVFDLNPACWINSRLSRVAITYEKYRFNSFTVTYHPAVPTSSSGVVALYYEPEIYDNVTSSPIQALTHMTSGMAPVWQNFSISARTPKEDPTTYFCTQKAAVERALLSQGKVVAVSTCPTQLTQGYLRIDYDITFFYPELETNNPGEQYRKSTLTMTAAANNTIISPPVLPSVGVKLFEVTVMNTLGAMFVADPSNPYTYAAGSLLYTAWDGFVWRLYPDIASATTKSGPLASVAALAAVAVDVFLRVLSGTGNV